MWRTDSELTWRFDGRSIDNTGELPDASYNCWFWMSFVLKKTSSKLWWNFETKDSNESVNFSKPLDPSSKKAHGLQVSPLRHHHRNEAKGTRPLWKGQHHITICQKWRRRRIFLNKNWLCLVCGRRNSCTCAYRSDLIKFDLNQTNCLYLSFHQSELASENRKYFGVKSWIQNYFQRLLAFRKPNRWAIQPKHKPKMTNEENETQQEYHLAVLIGDSISR